jgi:hypothetical protein
MSPAAHEANNPRETTPPMRKILISSAIVLSLASGGAALAATKPAAAKPATPAASTKVASSKASECAKQWKAEKTHTQTRKAFMAACTKA